MFRPNFKSIVSTVLEIIAIVVLGGGCEPQSSGRGGRRESGWYRSKERWGFSIRPP